MNRIIRLNILGVLCSGISCMGQFVNADVAAKSYANYVVLGQSSQGKNIALARTIIDEAQLCPSIAPIKSQATQKANADAVQIMIPRENPNHFSVIVCEAQIDFDKAYQVQFKQQTVRLPVAMSNPQNIFVYGDSGCKRAKPGKGGCLPGEAAEPFKTLADAGAKMKPDLILHMGDYNYRGTSGDVYFTEKNQQGQLQQVKHWTYDAGDGSSQAEHCEQQPGTPFYSQSADNSNYPDIWQNWHDDVFKPAKKLLAAAPWVVARGNHELCSRAGAGYFYFLDPHSNLITGDQQLSCPKPQLNLSAIDNTIQIPSYKVGFNNLDIIVVDSANACDSFTDSPFTSIYTKEFAAINQMTGDKPAWLMGHRPIWGITEYYATESTGCTSTNQFGCINQMMQQAIAQQPGKRLSSAIQLLLAGHMHRYQSVSFAQDRAPQLVIGTSGVALDSAAPDGAVTASIDNQQVRVLTTNNELRYNNKIVDAYGFLTMNVKANGQWQAKLVNPAKKLTLVNCSSEQNLAQGLCEFSSGISVTQ
ncbi:metallophosphoesterase [Aliikangiella maris]|uniref:Metallophosphoesterase n=2 Tax=Aliikangiella maris TaxID=3162458 RepID=A0ABV3MSL3_9GAMM